MGALDWQVPSFAAIRCRGTQYTLHSAGTVCGRSFLFSVGSVVRLSLCFLAGLLPYIYIVWAAHDAPPGSWGNTATWDGFWKHFLRSEYGTFRLYSGDDGTSDQLMLALSYYAHDLIVEQGLYVAAIPAAVGLVGYRHNRSVAAIIGNPSPVGRTPCCPWSVPH